jgi:hypothetical protein
VPPLYRSARMRKRSLILALLSLLLAWKAIRTDWVVSAPYWFGDPSKTSAPGGDHSTYDISTPISPFWRPPQPADVEVGAATWESLYPAGGAWGISGTPKLHPNWMLIGIKVLGSFVLIFPILLILRRIFLRPATSIRAQP